MLSTWLFTIRQITGVRQQNCLTDIICSLSSLAPPLQAGGPPAGLDDSIRLLDSLSFPP